MITHEEMRNYVVVKLIKEKVNLDEVIKYISQQEKVTELMKLYKSVYSPIRVHRYPEIDDKIRKIEKELGEMK